MLGKNPVVLPVLAAATAQAGGIKISSAATDGQIEVFMCLLMHKKCVFHYFKQLCKYIGKTFE
jgi:hypothetical protein